MRKILDEDSTEPATVIRAGIIQVTILWLYRTNPAWGPLPFTLEFVGSEDDIFKSVFYDDFPFVTKIQIPLLKSYNLQNMNT